MTTTLTFSIRELIPYINWKYLYHAWGVKGEQALELYQESQIILHKWDADGLQTRFRIRLFFANSNGDDIMLYEELSLSDVSRFSSSFSNRYVVLPLLRQQHSPYLCLADFLPPIGMDAEHIGIFASLVPFDTHGLMEQTLADRLAEATAELGHEITRKSIWGYAPNEKLTPEEMFAEHYQGKRPAVGYPSLPDQSMNFILSDLLDFSSLGIRLTENGAMIPHAATSGLMISHPKCLHFSIGSIGHDQLQDYASRRGFTVEMIAKFVDTRQKL